MEKTLRRLGRNLRWLIASEAAGRIVGFFTTAIIARRFGLEQFGLFTLTLAFAEAFQQVVGLSSQEVIVRRTAGHPDRLGPVLSGMLAVQACAAVVSLMIAAAIGFAYGGDLVWMIPIGAWIGATRGTTGSFLAASASRDDFRPASLNAIWRRFALVAALLVFLFVQANIFLFWLVYAISEVAVTLVSIYTVHRFGDLDIRRFSSRQEITSLLREGLSFSALRWSGLLHSRLDIVLIERFLGREAVGIYGAAYRLLDVFKLLPNLAETTLLPIVTRLLGRRAELVESMERSIKALATLSIPLGVGAWIVADLAVRLVFGDAYAGAAYPWALLMASLAVSSIARPALVLLRAQGRLRVANAASWIAVAINLLLNLLWIPRFGILGSAAATAASEVAFVLYSAWLVRNDVVWFRVMRGLIPSVIAASAMAVTGWGLSQLNLPTLVIALAAALAYCAVLVVARGLDQRDRDGIRMLIQG